MRAAAVRAQARTETVLTLRRGESVLLTLVIPAVVLGFFASVDVLPTEVAADDPVDFLAPGVLTLAVLSTAMVGVAIATAFERHYLVLKRLGATPLGRGGLLAGKGAGVAVVLVLQVAVLGAEAVALGWRPHAGGLAPALAGMALGLAAFGGIGMLMAGTMPATLVLGVANGAWLVMLLLGGVMIPLAELPGALEAVARALPAAALADILFSSLTEGSAAEARSWLVLGVWAAVAPSLAARWFRWE